MATATLSQTLPADDHRPPVSKRAMPWLFSTAGHLVLVLMMVATLEQQRGVGDVDRPNRGIMLASVNSGASDGSDPAVEAAKFYADDESNFVQTTNGLQTDPSNDVIKLHTEGELTSLFDEPPPVNLDDLVASASASQTEGPRAANAHVPSATDMIRAGSNSRGAGHSSGANRGGGGGPVGLAKVIEKGAARTGIFGVSGVGYKFVYVIDRSGSMDNLAGAPFAAAKAELIQSLHELDKVHQFQIIFYNESPRLFTLNDEEGRLLFGTDQNKRLAERFVDGITANGATHHERALMLALRLNPDVIFFLTDADEPTMSAKQLADIARNNNGATINAIEFGDGPQADSENFLVQLARQNGGQHVYVDVSELPHP